ncbi:MAG: hypothetical protein JNK15_05885 [Planctomycetes bacterium]|nr:hypothetical protein [Planctomycetota bacterium]
MKPWHQTLLLGAGFGVSFLLGQAVPNLVSSQGQPAANQLTAQGRGPVNPPAAPTEPATGTGTDNTLVYSEEGGHSASANGFVAVTGSYGIGTSVLYLIDTVNRQLAVYEARGGSSEQRRIVLVGARRIDLDLQLRSYNDRSEYEYDELQELFEKRGRKDHEVKTGLEAAPGDRK